MNDKLPQRQAFFLTVLFLLGDGSITGTKAQLREQWMVFLPMTVLAIFIVWLYFSGGNVLDQKNGFRKWALLPFGVLAVAVAAETVRQYLEFVLFSDLSHTSKWFFALIFGFTTLAFAIRDTGALGRCGWLLAPVAIVLLLVLLGASVPFWQPEKLLPIFESEPKQIGQAFITEASQLLLPLFFCYAVLRQGCKEKRGMYSAVIFVLVLLFLNRAANVMILGSMTGGYEYPSYVASGLIFYGDMLQRFEVLSVCAFLICQPIKCAICVIFAKKAMEAVWPKSKKYSAVILTAAATICGMAVQVQISYVLLLPVLAAPLIFRKRDGAAGQKQPAGDKT